MRHSWMKSSRHKKYTIISFGITDHLDLTILLAFFKINLKESAIDSAVQTLKSLDLNGQIEALSIIWHILIADGLMQLGESVLMNNLLTEFNIKIETISNNLQEMLS